MTHRPILWTESGVSETRTDYPDRPVIFHREGVFYPVLVYRDNGFADLAEHAALNPGTLRITDAVTGEVLWSPAQ